MSAIDDAIADAKAELAKAPTPPAGGDAPAPAPGLMQGGAIDSAIADARQIEQLAQSGKLPSPAQISGVEAPAGEPGYGMTGAIAHGLTLGASDLASGYMRDAIRKGATALGAGLPEDANRQWGRGAEEYQAARERYAANNPISNFAGNLLGGVMMPMGKFAKAGEYIAPYATQLAERLGVSAAPRLTTAGVPLATRAEQVGSAAGNVLGGAALGGGMGAIGGAIDEFPEGRAAMLDAALRGGVFGAGVGAAAPAVIGTGLGAYRLGRDYIGPQSRASAFSSGAAERALQGRTEDLPAAIANYDDTSPFPGFNKSLAQATASPGSPGVPARADPGLVRMEGDLVAQLGPRDVSTLTPSEQGLLDVVPQQRDAKTAALQSVVGDTAAQQAAIEQQRLALGTPAREVEQLGATAKAEMQAGKTAGKEAIVGRPERPDMPAIEGMPNVDPSIPLNNKPVADQAVAIQRRILPEDRAPTPEEQALFDKARMWGTNISFERTNALRSDILQTIREQVGAGNANSPMVARLSELRGVIDKNIENQLPADQFAIWRARQDAFRQQAEIYKNRDTGPLLAGREAGDYRVSETATPAAIIRDNQSATAFLNAGGTPETLRTALITDLHAQGDLTPAKIAKWRQDNEGALRAVPGLDTEVGNLAQSQARLNASQRLESFINPQTQAIDQTAFRKWMRTNQGSLASDGISPQGLDTLDKLVSSMDLPPPGTARTIGANKSGSPSAYSNMFQVIHKAITTTGSTMANVGGLIAAGVADAALTGGASTGIYLGARMLQRLHENGINNINQVLAEAAVNPAFGRTLLMANTPRNQQFIDRSMQAALRGMSAGRLTPGAGAIDRQGLAEERTRRRGQELLTAP
jgi:hypothetical protein